MDTFLNILILGLPTIVAITLHEAAHGFVALWHGDDTAKRAGRVSLNPLRHVDLIGTIILPGVLLTLHAPVVFGYAKPVPVNFSRLENPRKDSIYVAGAGPAMNILLAFCSAFLFHFLALLPHDLASLGQQILSLSLTVNVTLAVFNMLPLPPLDGGRVAVGMLPDVLAFPLARLEPYGMLIISGLLLIPPLFGVNLLGPLLLWPIEKIVGAIVFLTGLP